jgi:hypothetical protein
MRLPQPHIDSCICYSYRLARDKMRRAASGQARRTARDDLLLCSLVCCSHRTRVRPVHPRIALGFSENQTIAVLVNTVKVQNFAFPTQRYPCCRPMFRRCASLVMVGRPVKDVHGTGAYMEETELPQTWAIRSRTSMALSVKGLCRGQG